MSGYGRAIQPPGDKARIVNNRVKPFDAKEEIDRERATEILDYVVQRKKKLLQIKET
jgi:hypothetical protein